MKPFEESKLRAAGNLLSFDEFRLLSDMPNGYNESKIKKILAQAEKYLDKEIPILPASLFHEFFVNGNRANYENKYFERRTMAAYLAVAENYEKKGRFTEKLMDAVWAIMEESSWIIPAHLYLSGIGAQWELPPVYGNNANHGIDLFAAATGGTLASVYMLAKESLDKISPVICEKMEYMLHERIVRPFLECVFWWMGIGGRRVNNWTPWILSNILLCTAIMEKSNYYRERVVEHSMLCLDNFFACYKPDGGCDEGPAYWGAAGAAMFDCLELIEDMSGGRLSIYKNELVRNIGEYIFKVNINGSNFVNFADCAPRTNPSPSMLIRFGEKCDSPFLVSFGKKQAVYGDMFFSQSHMYRSLKTLHYPDIAAEVCPMPTKTYLSDLKVMTARSTDDSAKGMFLAAKGGYNDEMHNHNDVGNFIVYYDGKPVIIDTGVGQYTKQTFSPQRYELWFMQSGYHNLPSFDGVDQMNGAKYTSECEEYDESIPSLTLQLRKAYPEAAGIDSYVRTCCLSDGVVTVTDDIELKDEKTVEFHLMTCVAPTPTSKGTLALAEGRTLSYDPSLSCEIEEFDPVGMDTKNAWGTEKLWRIKLTAKTKCGKYIFTVN